MLFENRSGMRKKKERIPRPQFKISPSSGRGWTISSKMRDFGGKCRCVNQSTTLSITFGPIATYLRRYYSALPSDDPPLSRWVLPYWLRNRNDRQCRSSYPHHPGFFILLLCSINADPLSRLNSLLTEDICYWDCFPNRFYCLS